MSVKVNISRYFFGGWANESVVAEVSGNTVGQCLNHLVRQFPAIKRGLVDKNRKLHSYVDIYVNRESAYPEELDKAVKDGDELHITFLISGG